MSLSLTRLARIVAHAGCMLFISATLAVSPSQAKEERKASSEDAIDQIAPLSHHNYGEIITELPPLKPYKKNAATKPAQPSPAASQAKALEPPKSADAPTEVVVAPPSPEVVSQPVAAPVEAKESAAPADIKSVAPVAEAKATTATEALTTPAPINAIAPAAPAENIAAAPQAAEIAKPQSAPLTQSIEAPVTAPAGSQESDVAANPAPVTQASDVPTAAPAPVSVATAAAADSQPKRPAALDAARIAAIIQSGVKGPADVRLADRAIYSLPAERVFLPKDKARELVEGAGHQWDDSTVGVVLGEATGSEWLAFVDLLDDGYIKDNEASNLDATKLLDAYKVGVAADNEARVRAGAKPLVVTGWVDAPRYDEMHRLVSCVGASAEPASDPKNGIVNCTSYALGRSGAFKVIVATSGEGYAKLKDEASKIAGSIVYDPGKGYADVDLVKDPISPYGLVALATGSFAAKPATSAPAHAAETPSSGGDRMIEYGALLVAGFAAIVLMARRLMAKPAPVKAKTATAARNATQTVAKKEPQSLVASLSAKLAKMRSKPKAKPETLVAAPAVAASSGAQMQEGEQPASVLAKLAALMRKKAPEPTHVQLNPSRLARSAPSERAVLRGGAPDLVTEPAMAQDESMKNEASPVVSEEHQLIEPGAADAEALRLREPLRRANA